MKMLTIKMMLIIALAIFASPKSVTHQLSVGTAPTMKHQAHSKHVLQMAQNNRRHTLSASNLKHETEIIQEPMVTDGFSFRLNIAIGDVPYNVNLDTGSSDFMFKGQNTKGQPDEKYKCEEHDCEKIREDLSVGYLDGFLQCYSTNEEIEFAGEKFEGEIVVAYQADKKFDTVQGICGVSFPQLARNRPTFIEILIENEIVDKYAYGVNFNFIKPNRSFINFGESNSSLYEGELDIYKLTSKHSINVNFKWARFNEDGKKMRMNSALLDTGTTCITFPGKFKEQILSAFQNQNTVNRCYFYEESLKGFSVLICRIMDFDQLPVLEIVLDEKIYKIAKETYIQYCMEHNNIQYCTTFIEIMGNRGNSIILGDGFFKRYYTFFDLEDREVGIAENKEVLTVQDILNQPPQDVYLEEDWAPLNY